MYKFICLLIVLSIFSINSVLSAEFEDCGNSWVCFYIEKKSLNEIYILGSTAGTFTKVTVSGCGDDDSTCILHKKTNATISISFDLSKIINLIVM